MKPSLSIDDTINSRIVNSIFFRKTLHAVTLDLSFFTDSMNIVIRKLYVIILLSLWIISTTTQDAILSICQFRTKNKMMRIDTATSIAQMLNLEIFRKSTTKKHPAYAMCLPTFISKPEFSITCRKMYCPCPFPTITPRTIRLFTIDVQKKSRYGGGFVSHTSPESIRDLGFFSIKIPGNPL